MKKGDGLITILGKTPEEDINIPPIKLDEIERETIEQYHEIVPESLRQKLKQNYTQKEKQK